MMFDAQVTAMGMDVLTPTPDAEGNVPEGPINLAVQLATLFPSPQGAMPIPIGVIRVPFSPKVARDLAKQLTDAADLVPEPSEPSGLVTATPADMANVARQAEAAAELKKTPKGKGKK